MHPFHFRLPRWVGVDYWYVQGAQGFISACFLSQKIHSTAKLAVVDVIESACLLGQKTYSAAKLDVVDVIEKGKGNLCDTTKVKIFPFFTETLPDAARERAIRYVEFASGKFAPLIGEYSGDIALGALVIVGSLVLLLIAKSL